MILVNAGQLETGTELKRLEAELEKTYKQARDEIQKKLDDYLKKFKVQEKEWRKKLDSGDITEERFKKWYQGKVMNAKRWAAMRDTLAEDLTNVNVMANDLVRDSMLHTFAINHNYGTYEIENGLSVNTSYTLYDAAMQSITTYTKLGLRLGVFGGAVVAFFSFIIGLVYLIMKLVNWYGFEAGQAPVVIGIFFFGGVIMLFLGFIGEYIMSMNQRIMNRPLVIEEERLNFDENEDKA